MTDLQRAQQSNPRRRRRRRNQRRKNLGTTAKVLLAVGGGIVALYVITWGVQLSKRGQPQPPKGTVIPDTGKPMDGVENGWTWHIRYDASQSSFPYAWSIEKGDERSASASATYEEARAAISNSIASGGWF